VAGGEPLCNLAMLGIEIDGRMRVADMQLPRDLGLVECPDRMIGEFESARAVTAAERGGRSVLGP
jgi:hypothetical protein